jgi:serine/threonine-protein kinase
MPIDPDRLIPGGALLGPVFASLAPKRDDDGVPTAAFGPFRAVRELGRGGMAVVYLGERVEGGFEQQVALKLVSVQGDTAALQILFRQERQLLARLIHPNIARLLDGGRLDDGRLWFALDLVEGERIDRWCRDRPLDIDSRLDLFRQVGEAVAFAHARLAVHRDIKPSNILVSDESQVKLLDFGIAALLDEAGVAIAPAHAMTPGYASPEQLRGEAATTASDIWQLGRLLADLLAIDAATTLSVANTTDAGLALTPSHAIVQPGDRDLAAIIDRAMDDDPVDRYRTVAELIDDLDRWRQRRPVMARRGGAGYRFGRFLSRRRWMVAGAAFATLVLTGAVIAFTLGLAHQRNTANREAERAKAALGFLTDMFRVANPAVNRGDQLSANEILERGTAQLDTDLVDQPEVRASLLDTIGRVHMGLGQSGRAEPLLQQSVELSRGLHEPDPLALAARLRALAQVQWRLGQLTQARASCDEAIALLGDPGVDPELRARLLNTRAIVILLLGDAATAERMQREALTFIEAHVGADSQLAGYGWNNLGRMLADQERIAEAATAFERAVGILQSTLGADHPDTLDIATSRARQIGFSGRTEQALADLANTQAGMVRVLGEKDWRYGFTVLSEAEIRLHAGQIDAVLPLAQRALAIYRKSAGEDNLFTAVAWELLGKVHAARGEHADALVAFRGGLRIRTAQLADDHPDLALSRADVGRELCALGEVAAGEALLRRALAIPRPPSAAAHDMSRCRRSGAARAGKA